MDVGVGVGVGVGVNVALGVSVGTMVSVGNGLADPVGTGVGKNVVLSPLVTGGASVTGCIILKLHDAIAKAHKIATIDTNTLEVDEIIRQALKRLMR